MKKVKWLLLVAVMLLSVGGCVEGIFTDPDTGEQTRYSYIDPNTAGQVENAVEGAVGTAAALLPLLPWLAPFVAAGGGILGTYRKLKPKLTASENEKNNFVRGGEALATVLNEVKVNHPEVWNDIGPRISAVVKESAAIENAIRGFRHLAPRV